MARMADFFQRTPVTLLCVLDAVFLILFLYVFKTDYPDAVRSVIKDALIGWNGALAIAINIHRVGSDVKLEGDANKVSVTSSEPDNKS
jgi:hypothetical protein